MTETTASEGVACGRGAERRRSFEPFCDKRRGGGYAGLRWVPLEAVSAGAAVARTMRLVEYR